MLANAAVFVITITCYKFYVRHLNTKLEAGGEKAKETMKGGVTEEQIRSGWRYEGY